MCLFHSFSTLRTSTRRSWAARRELSSRQLSKARRTYGGWTAITRPSRIGSRETPRKSALNARTCWWRNIFFYIRVSKVLRSQRCQHASIMISYVWVFFARCFLIGKWIIILNNFRASRFTNFLIRIPRHSLQEVYETSIFEGVSVHRCIFLWNRRTHNLRLLTSILHCDIRLQSALIATRHTNGIVLVDENLNVTLGDAHVFRGFLKLWWMRFGNQRTFQHFWWLSTRSGSSGDSMLLESQRFSRILIFSYFNIKHYFFYKV